MCYIFKQQNQLSANKEQMNIKNEKKYIFVKGHYCIKHFFYVELLGIFILYNHQDPCYFYVILIHKVTVAPKLKLKN